MSGTNLKTLPRTGFIVCQIGTFRALGGLQVVEKSTIGGGFAGKFIHII